MDPKEYSLAESLLENTMSYLRIKNRGGQPVDRDH